MIFDGHVHDVHDKFRSSVMSTYRLPPALAASLHTARADAVRRVVAELDEGVAQAWAILCVRSDAGQNLPATAQELHAAWAAYFLGTVRPVSDFVHALERLASLGLALKAAAGGVAATGDPLMARLTARVSLAQLRRIDDLQVAMLEEALAEQRVRSRTNARQQRAADSLGGLRQMVVRPRSSWAFAPSI